jgi:hypothetical protein
MHPEKLPETGQLGNRGRGINVPVPPTVTVLVSSISVAPVTG